MYNSGVVLLLLCGVCHRRLYHLMCCYLPTQAELGQLLAILESPPGKRRPFYALPFYTMSFVAWDWKVAVRNARCYTSHLEVDCITYNLLLPFTSSVAILDSCSPLSVASSWYSVVFIHSAKYPWKSRLSYALHLHESSREHLMKHAEPTDHSCGCGYAQISYFQVPLRLLA